MTGLAHAVARVREQRRPVRFLASRLLARSRLCDVLPLDAPVTGGRVRFRPVMMAANLWCDPSTYDEDGTVATVLAELGPGDVFVDVGAHIGLHTLAGASAVGPAGRIISLEPHPRTYEYLAENVRRNGLAQVETHRLAADAIAGQRAFSDDPLEDRNRLDATGPLEVPAVRLDDLLAEVASVQLLKVDVEGDEVAVLTGASKVLERTAVVVAEAWDLDALRPLLADFDLTELSTGPGYVNVVGRRRPSQPS